MRIKRNHHSFHTTLPAADTSRKVAKNKANSSFRHDLKDSLKEEIKQRLKNLLVDIDAQGQMLLRKRTLESVLQYKTLVRKFLELVIKNVYLLKEKIDFSPKGKHNVFILVENVDNQLEELLKLALDKEINNLALLDKIGEIRGILIDLYS
ncbi:MAG: DUF327 family protein [Candidatus Omnitrophica bacterium]|nr:DUF327 family protein [Candidatus Omnitrophota bacterium]